MSAAAQAREDAAPRKRPTNTAGDAGDNAALMREIGSVKGFDPFPPDQYLTYQNQNYPPALRLWAWVLSKTIRQGYRSRFCVDERGRPLSIQDAADDLKMDLANTRHAWGRLVHENRVTQEGRRLVVRGEVKLPPDYLKPGRTESEKKVCTDLCRPYILKQINKLPQEKQKLLLDRYEREEKIERYLLQEAVAGVRSIFGQRKDSILLEYDVKPIREKKKRPAESPFVGIVLENLPRFVQTFSRSEQTPKSALYNAGKKSEQTTASLLGSELTQREAESSSSSAVVDAKPSETTTTIEPTPIQEGKPETLPEIGPARFSVRLVELFSAAGKPAPTAAQCDRVAAALPSDARQPYLDDLAGRIERIKHPGALAGDVAAFVPGWPNRRAALIEQREAERDEERRAAAFADRQHADLVDNLKQTLADPFATEADLAEARRHHGLAGYRPTPAEVLDRFDARVTAALADLKRLGAGEHADQCRVLLALARQMNTKRVKELDRDARRAASATAGSI